MPLAPALFKGHGSYMPSSRPRSRSPLAPGAAGGSQHLGSGRATLWVSTSFLAALSLSGCEPAPAGITTSGEPKLSAQEIERIDAIVLQHTAGHQGPPHEACVSIVHKTHGLMLERCYGGMDPETPVVLASLSKTMVGGILLKLEQDGLLDFDGPIDAYGFSRPDQVPVTPAQLLSNLSGLICSMNATPDQKWLCLFFPDDDLEACAHRLWVWHQQDKLFSPPDQNFCYGGAQWQIAGAVAQIASGRSWSELFEETYTRPCGLKRSGFSNHFNDHSPVFGDWSVYPHGFDPKQRSNNPNIEGGMFTTASDFSKLLLMMLRKGHCENGRVLSEASVDRITQDRLKLAANGAIGPGFAVEDILAYGRGYGLGWWVDRDTGQRSAPGIYGSTTWIAPDKSYAGLIALRSTGWVGRPLFRQLNPEIAKILERIK